MPSYNKLILSGSTNGRPIRVAGTNTSTATTIHTASTNTAVIDEIWLYAQNSDTTARKLTVQFGGATSPDDEIELTVGAEAGLTLVVPGLILKGAASACVVKAFAATTNVVTISGYVNQIT